MGHDDYKKIQGLVYHFLWKSYHERHYEDCVQFCAMLYFEGRTNVQWSVIEYCRQNGIGERGKVAARPMEAATFVGLGNDSESEVKDNGFIFEQVAHNNFLESIEDESDDKDCQMSFKGRLEEFLLPLQLKQETFEWITRIYRPSMTRERTFST